MGLRLESKTQICGEPARLARDVIRRFPHAGPNYPDFPGQTIAVALHLVSDSDRLLRLVEGLTVDGYLETAMGRERLKTMARVAAAAEGLAQSVSGKDDEEDAT